MTFHRLRATIKLIVLEREGESSVYVCMQLMIREEQLLHLHC